LRGKQWSVEEERQLRQLVEEGRSLDDISKVMSKSVLSVKAKLFNSGLNKLRVATSLGGAVATTTTATTPAPEASVSGTVTVGGLALKLREQLSSIEENLRLLDATNALLTDPTTTLNRDAVLRLRTAILGMKTYHELYVKYVDIRRLEDEVLELRRQLASEKDT
jgi:hypothetical protein